MVPAFRTLVLEPGGPPALAGAPALLNARWPGGAWPARLRRIGAAGPESPAGDAAARRLVAAAAGPVCPPPAGPRADADAVLAAMLGWLRQAVGCDAARALAYDPEAMLPVAFASGDERRWDEEAAACWMAFAEADAAQFALLSTSGAKVALRTAEPAAAPGPGWAALLAPGRWRHELRAAVADGNGRCWCSLAAFRGGGRPFGGAHAAAVARAVPGFAARLSHAIAAGPAPQLPGHPASLWLSDRGQLLVTTAGGRDWLSRLQTPGMPGRAGAVLAGLTARVQAGPGPDQVAPACVRLRGSRGEWLTVQGERLTGTDGRTHGISVIVGPAGWRRCCHCWRRHTGSRRVSARSSAACWAG